MQDILCVIQTSVLIQLLTARNYMCLCLDFSPFKNGFIMYHLTGLVQGLMVTYAHTRHSANT